MPQSKSQYTVKGVKTFHGHDGGCWECSLYNPDGKRVAVVTEDGWGGELQFHWLNHPQHTNPDSEALDDFCKTLPRYSSQWDKDGEDHETTADIYLSDLVNQFLDTKEVKKLVKTAAILDGTSIYTWKSPISDPIRKHIGEKYPDATILNDIPLEKAVELYQGLR